MYWGIVIGVGLGYMAGAIDGSAMKGDRIRDVPAVFKRNPAGYVPGAAVAVAVAALAQMLGRV